MPRRLAFTHLVDDDLQNSSVKAANDGRVLCAKNLGIYGNCIVLDHGYGLQSIYGHLREIDVKEGDMVKKGQKMGIAGETGLAGGVHVHFSLQIEGVQVNSREWWDEHWIHNRITSKPIERTTPQTAASFTTSKVSAIPSLGIRIVWTRSLAEIVTTGTRSFHPAIFEEDIVMGSVDFSALSPRHFLTGLR
ncbi:MAG TPA: M23 family metallopeptidase [Bryobacteraceae bacterium]|nr:M23 family metallopeptidase [Bryobacteraceae bacterium]